MILIFSSHKNGEAYIETKNLDGETNLKYKDSVKELFRPIQREATEEKQLDFYSNIRGEINCDSPNANLYEFKGLIFNSEVRTTINFHDLLKKGAMSDEKSMLFACEYNNLLLRGSSLKNTSYIVGIVTYSGHNNKIMLNSPNSRSKQSRLDSYMNRLLIMIVIFQLIVCFISAFLYTLLDNDVRLK